METMKNKTLIFRERSKSWRETLARASGRYSREKDVAHEEKKLTISLPRNDFKHTAHIGITGESFGETGFLTEKELEEKKLPPSASRILQHARTMNRSNSNNASKKIKSPILQHSVTILRPDRPLVSRRTQNDSDSEDEQLPTVETSDMLSSVLAVMETNGAESAKNDKIVPFQQVQIEESSEDEENTEEFDYEDVDDAIEVGPNESEPSVSNLGAHSMSFRSSASDNHEIRQQKLNAIVNRFNPGSSHKSGCTSSLRSNPQKSSEYTDSEDEETDTRESFSLDDDDAEEPQVVLRKSRQSSQKIENRRSLVDQIKSNELHILGHKNSLASSEREIIRARNFYSQKKCFSRNF